jgi:DNA-binding Xre family transcriptional regulator
MYKKDLSIACGLSTVTMTKLSKGLGVNTNILVRICKELKCDISEICEIVSDERENDLFATNIDG